MLQTQKSSRWLFFSLITLSKNIGAKFYSHLEVWPNSNEYIVSRVYRETICGIACNLSPPSPTGFQKQAKGGVGQADVGASRWGTIGCGSETRPAQDKSNASFITRFHARSGRTEEGERRSSGAKVKQSGGETRRLEGGSGQAGSGGEQREVMGCRSCTPARLRACSWPWVWWSSWWVGDDERPKGVMGKDDQTASRQPDILQP